MDDAKVSGDESFSPALWMVPSFCGAEEAWGVGSELKGSNSSKTVEAPSSVLMAGLTELGLLAIKTRFELTPIIGSWNDKNLVVVGKVSAFLDATMVGVALF